MPNNVRSQPGDDYRVRIRMYRQGLGDCFLLSFPKSKGKHVHVMVDCGVVLGTSEPDEVMKQVAADVHATTQGKVDVLVVTHEHWDHLSGFDENQARAVFNNLEIGTLWLAWTEDDRDPLANRLRVEREKKKQAAEAARKAAQERGLIDQAARMAEVLGFFGAAAAGDNDGGEVGGGTAGALNYLKGKCAPTIVQTGGEPLSIPGVRGVRVYVLGPPKDGAAMSKTNPHKGEGYGLATLGLDGASLSLADAFLAAFDPKDEYAQPFPSRLRRPKDELKIRLAAATAKAAAEVASPEAAPLPKAGIDWYADESTKWRDIDNAWLGIGERLALQLDNATNNTSLVLAFEFERSRDVLLFVGDAQAGNWRSWDNCEWMVKGKGGQLRKVTAADLLQRTVFYKVGHHGSHNATMRGKGLERMTNQNLAAVIPVDTAVAHNVKGWRHMPLPAIRTQLMSQCAVVFQSDSPPHEIRQVPQARWQESPEKFDVRMKNKATQKMETVRKQSLYTDYFL